MTYTYDDFYKAAQESGILGQISTEDLNLAKNNPDAGMSILGYKKDYAAATTDDQRALANNGANSVRQQNGAYTAGTMGNSYTKTADTPASYNESQYKSSVDADIQSVKDKVLNSSFSYDAETDKSAQSYKKMYTREGERATKNALGTAAANTGGIASTAAVTAAAQAGQYYASQLSDKTADLEAQAYSRYMQEKNLDLTILDAMNNLNSNEYNRYSNDRSFEYGKHVDGIQYNQATENSNKAELEARAETMASVGDFSLFKELGYSPEEIAKLEAAYVAKKTKSTSGSGSYTYNGTNNTPGQDPATKGSLAGAADEINGWISSGDSVNDIEADLEIAYNAQAMTDEDYKNYKLILDAKKADAARANSK